MDTYQKRYPGRKITQYDIPELVKNAFVKSATISNASSGFRKSGIWPLNRHVFSEEDFAPSSIYSDNTLPENVSNSIVNENSETGLPSCSSRIVHEVSSNVLDKSLSCDSSTTNSRSRSQIPEQSNVDSARATNSSAIHTIISNNESPNCSMKSINDKDVTTPNSGTNAVVRRKLSFSPNDVWPLPHMEISERQRQQRCQKSEILTSSPFKMQLLNKQNLNKRKLVSEHSKSDCKKNRPSKTAENSKKLKLLEPPGDHVPDKDVICIICSEEYSNSRNKEKWIQCNFCREWAHEQCTDYNIKQSFYICDHCR